MRLLARLFAVLAAGAYSLCAQSQTPALMPGLGQHHHTISTKNSEAQRFFDQGLTLVFGFNREEAERSFRRAAELDPESAMAFWGIALALGPCINNSDLDPPHEKAAYEGVQKALSLVSGAKEKERDYIQALAKRYSDDPKVDLRTLDAKYAIAMRELSKHYPDDLDAALYAESLMDLHPWKLWSLDGRPTESTEEILAVLESVLRRDPNHLGANHYYIHATEASPHPEWALASARRLETLAPAAGHLVHMPAHTYMRAGDYSAAAHSNAVAAEVDRAYLRESGTTGSMYDMMYYCHNLHFLAASYTMQGDFTHAKQAADELVVHVGPMLHEMPVAEVYVSYSIFVLVRLHRWDDVLKLSRPDPSLAMTTAFWHFGRGSAFAAKSQIAMAEGERRILETTRTETPPNLEFSTYSNKAQTFLDLALSILDARVEGPCAGSAGYERRTGTAKIVRLSGSGVKPKLRLVTKSELTGIDQRRLKIVSDGPIIRGAGRWRSNPRGGADVVYSLLLVEGVPCRHLARVWQNDNLSVCENSDKDTRLGNSFLEPWPATVVLRGILLARPRLGLTTRGGEQGRVLEKRQGVCRLRQQDLGGGVGGGSASPEERGSRASRQLTRGIDIQTAYGGVAHGFSASGSRIFREVGSRILTGGFG